MCIYIYIHYIHTHLAVYIYQIIYTLIFRNFLLENDIVYIKYNPVSKGAKQIKVILYIFPER